MNINLTMLGQAIAFSIFVIFCMKYVWPPVTAALSERQRKIAKGLESADRATRDLELAQQKVVQELRKAKEEAQSILDKANKRATQIVEESKETARQEGEKIISNAQAEVAQEVHRAREALRADISELAVSGAEKILQASVDRKAHADLLKQLTTTL